MARSRAILFLIVEAAPVILHAELDTPRVKLEIDDNALGLRVSHGIVDGLLSDAQEIVFDRLRERAECAADLHLSLNRSVGCQTPRSVCQGCRQIIVFKCL